MHLFSHCLWALIAGCLCILGSCAPNSTGERPNILFIMSDDHTSQAWGVYGGVLENVVHTPHIRRLADEGCLMRNTFCTNSICVPSRATILTGQYSHLNGVYTLSDPLDPERGHVAKMLRGAGYQTAVIGKWHLRSRPDGFDHYEVLPGQGRYQNPVLRTAENWESGGREYQGYSADVIGQLAVDWLESRDPASPFFLMCHFKATHEPFDYPARHRELYAGEEVPEPASLTHIGRAPSGRTFDGQVLEILTKRYETRDEFYPGGPFSTQGMDSLAARRKTYQKFVKDFMRGGAAIDDNIGRLLQYLDEKGLADNTVVIYTADQGYFLGEHGFFDKRLMYEESVRMPFVIRYPKEIEAGSENRDIVLNTDFAPLFLDYADLPVPDSMQGCSFRANLRGETPGDWRSSMYYRYWLHQTQRPAHFGVRTKRYKLIFFYGHPLEMTGADTTSTAPAWEFYDLENDPQELRNAYEDPQYREVIARLKAQLRMLREALGDRDAGRSVMENILEEHW